MVHEFCTVTEVRAAELKARTRKRAFDILTSVAQRVDEPNASVNSLKSWLRGKFFLLKS